jgi:hypothetical protein
MKTITNPQGAIYRLIGIGKCCGMEMDVGKIKVMTMSVLSYAAPIVADRNTCGMWNWVA